MWKLHILSTVAVVAMLLFAPTEAHAQIAISKVDRTNENIHPNAAEPLAVSKADCLAGTGNGFSFTLSNLTLSSVVEVWASDSGADCKQQVERNTNMTCLQVAELGQVSDESTTIDIASSDIAEVKSSVASCEDSGAGDGGQVIKLYFLVDPSQGDVTEAVEYDVTVDLLGPNPPSGVTASVNDETSLKIDFSPSTASTDIAGHYVFCDTEATETSADFAPHAAGGGGAGGSGGAASAGGAGGSAGGAGTTTGSGGTGSGGSGGSASSSVGGSGGTSSSGGDASCFSTNLAVGEVPIQANCGSASGSTATSVVASGLTKGAFVAVGIAAYDTLGNVGVLSELACGTPTEVTGFFDAYVDAGGRAGNGCGCSILGLHVDDPTRLRILLALSLLMVGMVLRRRRGVQ